MKTKWKKTLILPLLMLAFSFVSINPAEASLWEIRQSKICAIQVLVDVSGCGDWQWGTVQGTKDGCTPQRLSFCITTPCEPSVVEQ